jgi:dCMP deaminase
MRQSWDDYFIEMAQGVASRATCERLKVGAVLVQNRSVRGTGYNGAPRGAPDCLETGCLVVNNHCVRTVHAEANLILQTDASERVDSQVYVTHRPCWHCSNLLANSGVREIIYAEPYRKGVEEVYELLGLIGVKIRQHGD